MNELQLFNNPKFGDIRVIEIDGKPYFVASDVANALGYKNTSKAISDHCKGVTKRYILTNGGKQQMNVIPQGDIYRLAAKSELPGAEEFESWIFDEVLVSVGKHGAYMTSEKIEEVLLNPDTIIKIATQLKQEQEEKRKLQSKIDEQKPKVLLAEAVTASTNSISMNELAKILKQNGIDTGRNRLFSWMRDKGFLIRQTGDEYNLPTEYGARLGLFEVSSCPVIQEDKIVTKRTTKVTRKGQEYFIQKFVGGDYEHQNPVQ